MNASSRTCTPVRTSRLDPDLIRLLAADADDLPALSDEQIHCAAEILAGIHRRPRSATSQYVADRGVDFEVDGRMRISATVPAAPLLRQVELLGGPGASGLWRRAATEQAYCRAKATGWLTPAAAEKLACAIGLAPRERLARGVLKSHGLLTDGPSQGGTGYHRFAVNPACSRTGRNETGLRITGRRVFESGLAT